MKRIFTILLAATLVMALTACSPAASSSSTSSSASTSSDVSTSSTPSSSETMASGSSSSSEATSSAVVPSGNNPGTGTSYDQWAYDVAAGLKVDVAQVQDVINFFNSKMSEAKIDTDFYKAVNMTAEQAKSQFKTFEEFAKSVTALADKQTAK